MANYALAQIRWTRGRPSGQTAEDVMVNAIHFQCADGGLTSDDTDTFDGAWQDFITTDIPGFFSQDVHVQEIRYYNMPSSSGPLGDPAFTTNPTIAGTGARDATLPPQCAISVTMKTDIRRRWGRFYLGGLTTNVLLNGRIASTSLTLLASSVDTWGTTLRSNGNGVVVWHRSGWTAMDVQEWSIDDVWDVIRRRRYDQAFNRESGDFLT